MLYKKAIVALGLLIIVAWILTGCSPGGEEEGPADIDQPMEGGLNAQVGTGLNGWALGVENRGCWRSIPTKVESSKCIWRGISIVINGEYEYQVESERGWGSEALTELDIEWPCLPGETGEMAPQFVLLSNFRNSSGQEFDYETMEIKEVHIIAREVSLFRDEYRGEKCVWINFGPADVTTTVSF